MTSLESDIMDRQDKIGYVDTEPINTLLPSKPIVASNAHITIKEPKPQRQVWMEHVPHKPSVSFTPSTKEKEQDDLKDMMVSKLYELADMLKSINMDSSNTAAPASQLPPQHQPQLPPPQLPPPQLPQQQHQQPRLIRRKSVPTQPQPHYNHYYPPMYYQYYPYEEEEEYYYPPYNYYPYPYEQDPPHQYYRSTRRRSIGNLYESAHHPTLHRKASKPSLRQPTLDPRHYEHYHRVPKASYSDPYYPSSSSPHDYYL